jgi:hypothetical protein
VNGSNAFPISSTAVATPGPEPVPNVRGSSQSTARLGRHRWRTAVVEDDRSPLRRSCGLERRATGAAPSGLEPGLTAPRRGDEKPPTNAFEMPVPHWQQAWPRQDKRRLRERARSRRRESITV